MCTKETGMKQNSRKQVYDLQQASNLPDKYKDLWITNKRLMKQIDILKMQIAEKDRIIKELKVEIDSTILEDTKNKLNIMRMVEDEVNQKTQHTKQQYLNKLADHQTNLQKKALQLADAQKQLQIEKENNKRMNNKIIEIREHIIVALDQKDLIINQLTKIISHYQLDVKVQKIKKQAVMKHARAQDIQECAYHAQKSQNYGDKKHQTKKLKAHFKRNL